MQVKIKRLNERAVIPTYAKAGDAAVDLVAIAEHLTPDYIEYTTGLAVELPADHVGLLFPRSSISNYNLDLCNAVGILDSTYTGEIKLRFRATREYGAKKYNIGDRVGQLIVIPRPKLEFIEVAELGKTERGTGGFGSSGK